MGANEDLITEAREAMTRQEWMPAGLAIRLADALEAVEAIARVNAMNMSDWLGMKERAESAELRIAAVEKVVDEERIPDEVFGDDWVPADKLRAALQAVAEASDTDEKGGE